MSDESDDNFEHRKLDSFVGNLSETPGLIADWDQLHSQAVADLTSAQDFFFVATFAIDNGQPAVLTRLAFRRLPESEEETQDYYREIANTLHVAIEEQVRSFMETNEDTETS